MITIEYVEGQEQTRAPVRRPIEGRMLRLLDRVEMLPPAAVARVEALVAAEWEAAALERDAVDGSAGR